MPFHMGPMEIGLIVLLVLIIFGVGKLPQVGGAIGKGLNAFRKGQQGIDVEEEAPESKLKRKTTVTSKSSKTKSES